MKLRMSVASFVLAVLAMMGLTAPVFAGDLVPFYGTLEGFEEVLVPPPVATIHGVGGGAATQLGHYTYDLDATVDFTDPPPKGVGTLTLTAANGDTLIVGTTGVSVPVIPGQVILITEEALVIDGTGRFAGATGSFTLTRLKYQATGLTIGSFEGSISTPGPDHP